AREGAASPSTLLPSASVRYLSRRAPASPSATVTAIVSSDNSGAAFIMGEDTSSGQNVPPPTGLNTPENIRRLKFVVAGLGALMVVGFLVVIVTIANRASSLGGEREVRAPGGRFGVSEIGVAPGERIRAVVAMEGDRLAVHLASDSA